MFVVGKAGTTMNSTNSNYSPIAVRNSLARLLSADCGCSLEAMPPTVLSPLSYSTRSES